MRKSVFVIAYLSATCSIVMAEANSVAAEIKDKIAFNITSDFYSKYVWRGQLINDDFVFQPSISANYKGWTATTWGSVNLTDYKGPHGDQSGEFDEYDLVLDYSNKLSEDSKIGYSLGAIHYHFPSFSATDTTEVYWGFNFDLPLNPAIKVYHGLGNENGTYANFSIGHTYDKFYKFTETCYCNLQWGVALGFANGTYNKDYWGVDGTRLNDLAFTLALPICFPGGWTVKPSLNYVTLADGKIRNSDLYSKSSDYFFTGVSISKSF